MHSRCE